MMTNKTTRETINNKQCTVIRKPFDAEWVKEQLSMFLAVNVTARLPNGLEPTRIIYDITGEDDVELFHTMVRDYTLDEANELIKLVTILPALPRNPKPEDAKRLYEYMAEGIRLYLKANVGEMIHQGALEGVGHTATHYWHIDGTSGTGDIFYLSQNLGGSVVEITHATLEGERVEIAIEEQSND